MVLHIGEETNKMHQMVWRVIKRYKYLSFKSHITLEVVITRKIDFS